VVKKVHVFIEFRPRDHERHERRKLLSPSRDVNVRSTPT